MSKETYRKWQRQRYETIYKPAYDALMKFYPLTLEDLDGERWLPIPNWEDYHGSNFGRVKSCKRGKVKIMKPSLIRHGYLRVDLYKDGRQKCFLVHRLVAELFIANPEGKPEVNHLDGDKLNNHVSNLEWTTSRENTQHALASRLSPLGEDRTQAKLTNKQVVFIRNNPDGLTTVELAEMFGVCDETISKIQLGKRYKDASGSVREANPHPLKISVEGRNQIRAEYQPRKRGHSSISLGKKYGVAPATILRIVNETSCLATSKRP